MSEYDDLIKKYGNGSAPAISEEAKPYLDLIKKYGNTEIDTPVTPAPAATPSYYPQPGRPTTGEVSVSNPAIEDLKNAPGYFYRKTGENYNTARNLAGEGIADIGRGMPLPGIVKTAIGAVGMPFAPISAAVSGVDKFAGRATGNKDFEPAELALTTGLPIGKGVSSVIKNTVPSQRALQLIVDKVGPENLGEGLQRMRENPSLSPMDVFPQVRSMAQGLATEVGPQQTVLTKAVEVRKASTKGNVESALNESMGDTVNVYDKLNQMKQKAKDTGQQLINPIVQNTKPVDITDLIKSIDKSISDTAVGAATLKALKEGKTPTRDLGPTQTRLFQLRNEIRGDWTDKTPMFSDVAGDQGLHRIQKDLRAEAQTLLDSPVGSDKLLGQKLMSFRNKIVDSIDSGTGGKYKEGLAQYRDDMQIQEAFDKGTEILRNRSTKYDDRPEFWANWLKNATDAEKEAAREGARVAVDQQINGMRNAVGKKGTEIPEVDFNAKKLKMLFDEKEIETSFKKLRDEKDKADTNQKIWEGSQTQFRQAGQDAIKVRPPYKPGSASLLPVAVSEGLSTYMGSPGVGTAAALSYEGVRHVLNKIGQKLDRKTNVELANIASATGEARDKLIETLSNYTPQGKLSSRQKLHLALPVALQP